MSNIHENEQFSKFLTQVSNHTKAKPRKITQWSKQLENKLRKLYVKEGRTIHAIARMLGGREYEIAEAIERFGFSTEPVKLKDIHAKPTSPNGQGNSTKQKQSPSRPHKLWRLLPCLGSRQNSKNRMT